jgi:hypothetical protein
MVTEADIRLADGRTLHAYDTRSDGIASSPGAPVAVFWHHGSPNVGSPPASARDARGCRAGAHATSRRSAGLMFRRPW